MISDSTASRDYHAAVPFRPRLERGCRLFNSLFLGSHWTKGRDESRRSEVTMVNCMTLTGYLDF